jgi:hypothetical protein
MRWWDGLRREEYPESSGVAPPEPRIRDSLRMKRDFLRGYAKPQSERRATPTTSSAGE